MVTTTKPKKKKEKRVVNEGVAHIYASFNNTIITITDKQGNTLSWATSGGSGFQRFKKKYSICSSDSCRKSWNKSCGVWSKKLRGSS